MSSREFVPRRLGTGQPVVLAVGAGRVTRSGDGDPLEPTVAVALDGRNRPEREGSHHIVTGQALDPGTPPFTEGRAHVLDGSRLPRFCDSPIG